MSLTLLSSIALIALASGWNCAMFARKHWVNMPLQKKTVSATIIDKKVVTQLNADDQYWICVRSRMLGLKYEFLASAHNFSVMNLGGSGRLTYEGEFLVHFEPDKR